MYPIVEFHSVLILLFYALYLFEELTSTAINEFIRKIIVHKRDVERAIYAVERIKVCFNYIGGFENEFTKTDMQHSQANRHILKYIFRER